MATGDELRDDPQPAQAFENGDALADSLAPHVAASALESCEHGAVPEMMPRDPSGVAFSLRTFRAYAGPGWLMSLAYLDPGNLESDLQSGAYAGFSLIWVLCLCTMAGFVFQVCASRLGTVTGRDLAQTCRLAYPRRITLTIWIMVELAIIGADVQEVVGSAIALKTLFGWPLWLGSLFTGLDVFTFMAIHYFGKRILELFIFALVMLMTGCFFTNFGIMPPSASDLLSGFRFQCPGFAVVQLVGNVGALISPHNIYLHSALMRERRVGRGDDEHVAQANKYNAVDSAAALVMSLLINCALLSCFAKGFFVDACASAEGGPFACLPSASLDVPSNDGTCRTEEGLVGQCGEIGLQQGGDALLLLFGRHGALGRKMFALGTLAAGQASTMTSSFAGQYVTEGFVGVRMPMWLRTVVTRTLSLVPALVVAVLTSGTPNLNNTVNQWINIFQCVQLPFALLPMLHFVSDPTIMGSFALKPCWQVITWGMSAMITATTVYLVLVQVQGAVWWVRMLTDAALASYFVVLGIIVRSDMLRAARSSACMRRAKAVDEDKAQGEADNEEMS